MINLTCVEGLRRHGDDCDHDGSDDVDDGEDEVDLDGPLPLWMLVSEDGNTEDTEADGQPGGEPDIVHQGEDVAGAEIAEGKEGGEEDSRGWSHLL